MIITCPNCQSRSTLEDGKVPPRPFTVKCPKCQGAINVTPQGASAKAANAGPKAAPQGLLGEAVATAPDDEARGGAAPPIARPPEGVPIGAVPEGGLTQDMVGKMLPALLAAAAGSMQQSSADPGRPWQRRQALLCLGDSAIRQRAQLLLEASGYAIHLAETAAAALALFQEQRIGFVLVDHQFDPQGNGEATIRRAIAVLTPKQRRRVYLVEVFPEVRTLDTQAAFFKSVNLTVNSADIETLPQVLQRSLRDFNELYHPLNQATGTPPL